MTNKEALDIAANYDAVLEMTGVDFSYSLELLEESKKVKPVQDSLQNINSVLEKKSKHLQAREDKAGLEEELKIENQLAKAEWDKILESEFTGSFKPIDLSKIPTDSEHLDKRVNKDGVSIVRGAILFLSRKGLVNK